MWRLTLSVGVLHVLSAEYSVVMRGAWPGTLVDILLCSETLVSDMHHVSEVLVPVTLSCCVGARCLEPAGWLYTFEMVAEHFANLNLSVVVA